MGKLLTIYTDGACQVSTGNGGVGVVFIKDNNPETNYYNDENKPDRAKYLNANIFLDRKYETYKQRIECYSPSK